MTTVEKRPLTEEESQEAIRLMDAWRAYKAQHPGATQGWLGASTGLGSQGLMGQYLRGIIPLNLKALLAICKQIEADPKKISQRLTRDLDSATERSPVANELLKMLEEKVDNEKDLRILMQVILDQDPPEIPPHIRESVKSMVATLRNLIQQSAQRADK